MGSFEYQIRWYLQLPLFFKRQCHNQQKFGYMLVIGPPFQLLATRSKWRAACVPNNSTSLAAGRELVTALGGVALRPEQWTD
jgi:hypothetical protein